MRMLQCLALVAAAVSLSGCLLTKVVTVPMRVIGAVSTIVPVAGDAAHGTIDKAADVVDKVPL